MIHVHNPIERDFTMVPNQLWLAPGLSVTAKAIFAYLLSWRDGSAVRVAVIEDALCIGRDARRTAFKQLEAAGLLRIEVKNLDRGRFVTIRTVDASPLLAAPGPGNPSPVSPGPEKPAPVNQAVKGRKSTPPPPENPSPYKNKTKQKKNSAFEEGKEGSGATQAGSAPPDPVLSMLAERLNAGSYVAPSAVSTSKAAALVASGLVSSALLRSRGIAH